MSLEIRIKEENISNDLKKSQVVIKEEYKEYAVSTSINQQQFEEDVISLSYKAGAKTIPEKTSDLHLFTGPSGACMIKEGGEVGLGQLFGDKSNEIDDNGGHAVSTSTIKQEECQEDVTLLPQNQKPSTWWLYGENKDDEDKYDDGPSGVSMAIGGEIGFDPFVCIRNNEVDDNYEEEMATRQLILKMYPDLNKNYEPTVD